MNRRLRCLLILVLATSAGAQQKAQQKKPVSAARHDFRIAGTVVDDATGEPLPNTNVSIGTAEGQREPSTVTSAEDGSFLFSGLDPGKYWLAASRRGFSNQNFDEHEGFSTAIAVGPGLDSAGLMFRMRPDASISGTVSDQNGEAVRQAQVMLFQSLLTEGQQSTTSRGQTSADDQGHYHFSHLKPGTYFVAVVAQPWYAQPPRPVMQFTNGTLSSREGAEQNSPLDVAYPITFYAGATDANAATPVTLQAGERAVTNVGLAAVQALHLRLAGAIADPRQGVNAALTARIFDQSVPLMAQSAPVGNDLEIGGIAPGPIELTIHAGGANPHTWEQAVNLTRDAEISASAGTGAARVSGIAQLDGAPDQPPTVIQLWNRATGERLGVQVGARGEFEIPQPVAPGTYRVIAGARDAVVVRVAAVGAKVSGQNIDIAGGGAVQMVVTLSKNLGSVGGIALRNDKPVAGAMIVLVPRGLGVNEALVRRDQSDSDGTFSLRNVVPGHYTVIALEKGWEMEWGNPAVLAPYLKTGEAIEVAGSGKYRVRVKVQ